MVALAAPSCNAKLQPTVGATIHSAPPAVWPESVIGRLQGALRLNFHAGLIVALDLQLRQNRATVFHHFCCAKRAEKFKDKKSLNY